MLSRISLPIFLVAAAALFSACGSAGTSTAAEVQGDTLTHYATALALTEFPDYIAADVTVPWSKGYLARYVVPKSAGSRLPEGRTVIRPDDGGIISFANVYTAALSEFGILERLRGVADAGFLAQDDTVRALVSEGKVADVGSSMAPLIETIIDADPALVLASPYESGGAVSSMQNAGLPLVLMADYVEQDPRGRAEWIKFLGIITGKRAEAERIADAAINRYNSLAELTATAKNRPEVITEKPLQGLWYVPGGNSYVARLIKDAGGDYVWSDLDNSASVPQSIENVIERGSAAAVWLLKEAEDLTEASLKGMVPHASAFRAFPDSTFVCNTLTTSYFNDIALHPDRVLEDYIAIFHPELCGDSLHCRYYTPIR